MILAERPTLPVEGQCYVVKIQPPSSQPRSNKLSYTRLLRHKDRCSFTPSTVISPLRAPKFFSAQCSVTLSPWQFLCSKNISLEEKTKGDTVSPLSPFSDHRGSLAVTGQLRRNSAVAIPEAMKAAVNRT